MLKLKYVPINFFHINEDPYYVSEAAFPDGWATFQAEGVDDPNSPFFSRVLHVPPPPSGATIGRSYDLGHRGTKDTILSELSEAGLDQDLITTLTPVIGLRGPEAKKTAAAVPPPTITREAQYILFFKVYPDLEADTERLATKPDVEAACGKTDWSALDPKIKTVQVDVRYRGDDTPASRKILQRDVAKNDFAGFTTTMSDASIWIDRFGVPKGCFDARQDCLWG